MGTIKREWVRIVKDEPKFEGDAKDSIVYFVQCQVTKLVKIGYASNPWSRLSNLRVGSATQLNMLAMVRKPRSFEKELHERFKAHRKQGEWFAPADEIMALIKEYADAQAANHGCPSGDPTPDVLVGPKKRLTKRPRA